MLCISWMLLVSLIGTCGPVTLLLAASSAPQSVSHHQSQDRDSEFKSVPPASPTSHPSPVPAFLHAHLLPHSSLTQRTQPKHGHLRTPRSLTFLPQTSRSQMHGPSKVKPLGFNWISVAKTTCPPVIVLLDSVDSDHEQGKKPNVSCQTNPTCVIKEVKIQTASTQRPLRINRNTDLTLQGHVSYDCPDSTAKVYGRWLYDRVKRLGDVPDWSTHNQTQFLLTNATTVLTVNKSDFTLGVFIFNFSVSIIRSPPMPVVEASDTLYVIVRRIPLRAILLGPKLITVQFTDNIILNGSTSNDPELGEPLKGLTFNWYCSTDINHLNIKDNIMLSRKVCSPEQTSLRWLDHHDPDLYLLPKTLSGGHSYIFRMEIVRGVRSATADKFVSVLHGPEPGATILCVENCASRLIISDRLSLFLNVTNGTISRDKYKWSIQSLSGKVDFDWNALTTTGSHSSYLTVKPYAFRNFSEEQYYISVQLIPWSGTQDLTLRYTLTINYAPSHGKCEINLVKGTALDTIFFVHCVNFQDKNAPLTYKVVVSDSPNLANISSLQENTMGGISYLGPECTLSTFLPVGDLSNQHSLKLYVQVYDVLGSYSQVTLNTTVLAPTDQLSAKTVLRQLHNLIMGPNSTFSNLIQKKDFLGAGYLIYVAASVLNSMKSDPVVQKDKIQLREHLVNQTFELPLNTSEEITQVVAALGKLTQRVSDFTEVSKKRSTERLSQANQALQQHQKNNIHFPSEQVDTVCTGILTSLSNLLKLSTSRKGFGDAIYVTESLADTVLTRILPSNETRVLQSPGINMYVKKTIKWKADKVVAQQEDLWNDFHATVKVGNASGLPENAPISTAFITFAEDPFPWLTYPEHISTEVVAFQMSGLAADGEIEVTPLVVEVFLARKSLNFGVTNITVGPNRMATATTTGAFMFAVDCFEQRVLLLRIITEVTVLFTVSVYAGDNITDDALIASYLVPHDMPPMTNQTNLFDPTCFVNIARVVCLSPSLLQVIARRVQSKECVITIVLQAPRFLDRPSNKLVRISVFRDQCLEKSDIQSDWNENTCTLGERSSWERVHCVCRNKGSEQQQTTPAQIKLQQYSLYVGAKTIVVPNSVDLYAIKRTSHNPVILFVIVFIMITYIGLAFWALLRDETDRFLRQHVIIIPDDDPYDRTCYLVTVFTGSRCGSGTTANVFVQLLGTESVSNVHCLSHPYFLSLCTGSIDTFLLTTKSVLGDIHSIRVWHDNKGSSPSWYLSRIKVENLFTRQIWLFMCREWISVKTSLHRTYSPSQPDQILGKRDFFLIETAYKTWKSHMWFSVFADVVDKPFKRLQRLSCCLATLLSSLLCITLILNLTPSEEKESSQKKYTRSLMIGMLSVLITLPVQMIITALFIYSQRKPQVTLKEVTPQKHPDIQENLDNWRTLLVKWYKKETSEKKSTTDHEPIVKGIKLSRTNKNLNNIKGEGDGQIHSQETTLQADPTDTQIKTQFSLPSYFAYLAWFLIFAICGISLFVIVSHGLTYDDETAVKWLFAAFCAFFLSIFLVQPTKVILLTALRTYSSKYCKDICWVSNYQYTEIKLEQVNMASSQMADIHEEIVDLRKSRFYQSPKEMTS